MILKGLKGLCQLPPQLNISCLMGANRGSHAGTFRATVHLNAAFRISTQIMYSFPRGFGTHLLVDLHPGRPHSTLLRTRPIPTPAMSRKWTRNEPALSMAKSDPLSLR